MKAELIQVLREDKTTRVLIDGHDLSANIPLDSSVTVEVSPHNIPTVRLTLMANRVEVIDDLAARPADKSTSGASEKSAK